MKKNILKISIILLFLLFTGHLAAQDKKAADKDLSDSEIERLLSGVTVEKQARFYDSLAVRLRGRDPEKALAYINKALELSDSKPYTKELAHMLFVRAKCYRDMLAYKKALKDLDSLLVIYTKLGDLTWKGTVYADFGNLYYKKAEYDKALENYLKGLELAEKTGDKDLIYICLNNVGNILVINKNYDKAIEYYLKSYDITKEFDDPNQSASILDNIGLVYSTKGDFDMALVYSTTAAKMVEKTNNKQLLGEIYMNLGGIYNSMKKFDAALEYFNKAYDLSVETHSEFYIGGSLINIGDVYCSQKKYPEAVAVLEKALTLARESDTKFNIQAAALNLSTVYEAMKQHDKALEYYKLYSETKDSILTQESNSQINELSSKYESERKEQEIELLTKDKDLGEAKLKQKTTLNLFLFIGIGLIIVLLLLVFYRYQEKRKANSQLEEKNTAIHEQKELVLEKNKEITDSINYAKRIQDAMLPSRKILNEYFKENFIFYQPKDIISGDFYWAVRKKDELFIAAADCTGHGVPGALMSMIGVTFLRQIINEMNVTDTAEILNRLHSLVLGALNEDVARRDSKDGMDIALLKIDIVNKKAQFSGAVRPLYVTGRNGLEIIKGDRFSIGGVKTMEETFSKVDIDLSGGRSFYLFSDGFADQFGQATGKKFMVKKLQNTIGEIYKLPMEEQYDKLSVMFNDWKGTGEQTDDVLLVGIKV